MKVTICRKGYFSAAHKLYNPKWSKEKNDEVFEKCAYPNYHGHDFEVHVCVTGDVDPETGFVIRISDLKKIIKQEVEIPLDHKNINMDVPYFKDKNPTTENLAIFIYSQIKKHLKKEHQLEIILHETPKNYVRYGDS